MIRDASLFDDNVDADKELRNTEQPELNENIVLNHWRELLRQKPHYRITPGQRVARLVRGWTTSRPSP